VVGCEPPPGFRIHDRDALADNISAAADYTMRIVVARGSGNLMALKGFAADRPYDRPGAPASSRNQYCRFGHAVERAHGPRLEAIRTKRRCEPLNGVRPNRFGGVECHFPA
jgi:hypothetical protein